MEMKLPEAWSPLANTPLLLRRFIGMLSTRKLGIIGGSSLNIPFPNTLPLMLRHQFLFSTHIWTQCLRNIYTSVFI